jgi:hypothetical protein
MGQDREQGSIFAGLAGLLGLTLLAAYLAGLLSADPASYSRTMFFWLLGAVPAGSLYLAAGAGARASGGAPLRGLWASLAAASILFLSTWLLTGFHIPDRADPEFPFVFLPLLTFLVLHGFALAGILRSRLAGTALAAASFAALTFPLMAAESISQLHRGLLSMNALAIMAALAATAGPPAALLLNGAGRPRLARWLLALPALMGLAVMAALYAAAARITYYAEAPYVTDPDGEAGLGDAMLVQKPYTGELFFIDSGGKRALIQKGARFPLTKGLMPKWERDAVLAARGTDGELWLLHSPAENRERLVKGGLDGFTEQAVIPIKDGFPVLFEIGNEPGLLKHINGDGDYSAPLPYSGGPLAWTKRCEESLSCSYTMRTGNAKTIPPRLEGASLVRGKDSWAVPGAGKLGDAYFTLKLDSGEVYLVPAENGTGIFTYFCRSGAKAVIGWPGHIPYSGPPRAALPLSTPGGAVWWTDQESLAGHYRRIFLIANEEGRPLPPFRFSRQMIARTGTDEFRTTLLRAAGDDLWFNLHGKYMAKVKAGDPEQYQLWELPKLTIFSFSNPDYALSAKAVTAGVILTALDGVYFMDWEGRKKKL